MNLSSVVEVASLVSLLVLPSPASAQRSATRRAPQSTELSSPEVRVPVHLYSRHMGCAVFVNGEGPFNFNLDTGAGYHACIDRRLAERLGLETIQTVMNNDGTEGGRARRRIVAVNSIRFGGATFRGVYGLVDNYSWVNEDENMRVAGLLGYDLFAELLLTLDYPSHSVVLRRGELDPGDDHVQRYDEKRGIPTIRVKTGSYEFRAAIDSGSQSSILMPRRLLNKVSIIGEPRLAGTARTIYRGFDILSARLASPLEVAGHKLRSVDAFFADGWEESVLGQELLQDFVITIDQGNRLVRFAEPEGRASR